jgi:hypothetical protein
MQGFDQPKSQFFGLDIGLFGTGGHAARDRVRCHSSGGDILITTATFAAAAARAAFALACLRLAHGI